MMQKYIVDFYYRPELNAGPKARADVSKILEKYEYKKCYLYFSRDKRLKSVLSLFSLLWRISQRSEVVFQYPYGSKTWSNKISLYILKRIKKCYLVLLPHDLDSLRYNDGIAKWEMSCLNMADVIIAHTESMKSLIVEKCHIPSRRIFVLGIFDYLVDKLPLTEVNGNEEVVFAGALDKSAFLKKLDEVRNVNFKLYGVSMDLKSLVKDNVKYIGRFQPNDLSALKGKWGLVWDGTSLDTCDGIYGKYLIYNAPHKLSLYIAAGIPVIIWKDSAEADFVSKNKLGICVDSLANLCSVLDQISNEEYSLIKANVGKFSLKLRQGEMLTDIINRIHS